LVVGGGRVAGAKAAGLLAAEAHVTLVAPEVEEALRVLAGAAEPEPPEAASRAPRCGAVPSSAAAPHVEPAGAQATSSDAPLGTTPDVAAGRTPGVVPGAISTAAPGTTRAAAVPAASMTNASGAASVVAVPPEAADADGTRLEAAITVERRPYRSGEAGAYRFVIAATGIPEVDRLVVADASAAGVFVNAADDPEASSAHLPAIARSGPVSVAVSTSGTSPALASWLRDRLAEALASLLGPDAGALCSLLAEARQALKAAGTPTTAVNWRALLDGPLSCLVATGRDQEARALVERALQEASVSAARGAPGP
jgi:precorrin-2 dehydrogenase/sirohydrochlorin ferrochelatase